MKAYSVDLRQRVIQSRESVRKTTASYHISTNCIVRLRQQYRATGQWTPKPRGGNRPRCIDAAGEVWLQATLEQEPSLTLAALCTRYEAAHQVRVSKSSMDRTLTRLRISYKKKHRSIPSATLSASRSRPLLNR